jgi:hypothetical protein
MNLKIQRHRDKNGSPAALSGQFGRRLLKVKFLVMEIILVLVLSIGFCTPIKMFGGNMNTKRYFYNHAKTHRTIWVLKKVQPNKFIENRNDRMDVKWPDHPQPWPVDIPSSSTAYITHTLSETTIFVTTSFIDSLTTRSVSSNPSDIKIVDFIKMKFNKISPSIVSRYVASSFKPPQLKVEDKRKKIFFKNTLKVASKEADKVKSDDVQHQSPIESVITKNKTKHSMLSSILKSYYPKYNELLPLEPSFNYCEEYTKQGYYVHCKGCKKESDFLKMAKYFLFYTLNFAYFKFISLYFVCPPSTFTTVSAVIVTSPTTLFSTSVSTSVNEISILSSATVSSIFSSISLSIFASYTTETTLFDR